MGRRYDLGAAGESWKVRYRYRILKICFMPAMYGLYRMPGDNQGIYRDIYRDLVCQELQAIIALLIAISLSMPTLVHVLFISCVEYLLDYFCTTRIGIVVVHS